MPSATKAANQNAMTCHGRSNSWNGKAVSAGGCECATSTFSRPWSSRAAWLARHGNPYRLSVLDGDGKVGIDYGVYGVPETYVIDKRGVIRLKLTGPITRELIDGKLLPLIKELNRA